MAWNMRSWEEVSYSPDREDNQAEQSGKEKEQDEGGSVGENVVPLLQDTTNWPNDLKRERCVCYGVRVLTEGIKFSLGRSSHEISIGKLNYMDIIINFDTTQQSNKIMSKIYVTDISLDHLLNFSGGKESLLTRHIVHLQLFQDWKTLPKSTSNTMGCD